MLPRTEKSRRPKMNNKIYKLSFLFLIAALLFCSTAFAFDETVTIPAEDPGGVTLTLPAGAYIAEIAGGGISLFLPIHPQYQWLYGLSLGANAQGGQDEPNIGTLYFEADPKVFTQAAVEEKALKARTQNKEGTFLKFTLKKSKEVRLWVNDFDYSDNSGSERVRIYSVK